MNTINLQMPNCFANSSEIIFGSFFVSCLTLSEQDYKDFRIIRITLKNNSVLPLIR
jgi:hypothetical protein